MRLYPEIRIRISLFTLAAKGWITILHKSDCKITSIKQFKILSMKYNTIKLNISLENWPKHMAGKTV
jgi:hypothetical protein